MNLWGWKPGHVVKQGDEKVEMVSIVFTLVPVAKGKGEEQVKVYKLGRDGWNRLLKEKGRCRIHISGGWPCLGSKEGLCQ